MTRTYLGNNTYEYILNNGKVIVLDEHELFEFFEMYDFKEEVQDLELYVAELNSEIDAYQDDVGELEDTIFELDNKIDKLNDIIEDLKYENEKYQRELEEIENKSIYYVSHTFGQRSFKNIVEMANFRDTIKGDSTCWLEYTKTL